MPKAYNYDEITKIYKGEIDRQRDPVRSQKLGFDVWLMPANSTDIPPLEPKDGFDIIWNGDVWEYQEKKKYDEPQPYELTEEETKQQRIAELKAELSSTDYKVIKCSECSLTGIDLPYNIAELHAQRQALRDEINELEK